MSKPIPAPPVPNRMRTEPPPRFVRGVEPLAERTGSATGRLSHGTEALAAGSQFTDEFHMKTCPMGRGKTAHAPRTLGVFNL